MNHEPVTNDSTFVHTHTHTHTDYKICGKCQQVHIQIVNVVSSRDWTWKWGETEITLLLL